MQTLIFKAIRKGLKYCGQDFDRVRKLSVLSEYNPPNRNPVFSRTTEFGFGTITTCMLLMHSKIDRDNSEKIPSICCTGALVELCLLFHSEEELFQIRLGTPITVYEDFWSRVCHISFHF